MLANNTKTSYYSHHSPTFFFLLRGIRSTLKATGSLSESLSIGFRVYYALLFYLFLLSLSHLLFLRDFFFYAGSMRWKGIMAEELENKMRGFERFFFLPFRNHARSVFASRCPPPLPLLPLSPFVFLSFFSYFLFEVMTSHSS